jgi:hypothetical protein
MKDYGDARRAGKPTDQAEARLQDLFGKHYDLQLRLREKEIGRLVDRLNQLREEVGEKRPQRTEFIQQRMEQFRKRSLERHGPGEGPRPEGGNRDGATNAAPKP